MKKKIISILCALVMTFSIAEPIFANNDLYSKFKSTEITGLRDLFVGNFSSFDISKDGNSYNDSQKSLIILRAWQNGFDSFDELNQNVTNAAQKLRDMESNPKYLKKDEAGYKDGYESGTKVDFTPQRVTDSKNVFRFEDKEFIILDKTTNADGEEVFFVMAKDYYGTVASDPENIGRWDDTYYKLLQYKLTNSMAFGKYTSGYNLPNDILKNLDMFHEWNVEPGSGTGYTEETVVISPISVISVTEYKKYGEKIGLDRTSGVFWTRTPIKGKIEYHFTVNTASPSSTLSENKGWGGNYLRPVFYLKAKFFKEEKLEKSCKLVNEYIEDNLSMSELLDMYSEDEMITVFEKQVEPGEVKGDAIVGETLTASEATYKGSLELADIKATWVRSLDKNNWQVIPGASGKSYQIKDEDAGYYIGMAYTPTFKSEYFKNGETVYVYMTEPVFTEQEIANVVKSIDESTDIDEIRGLLRDYEPLFGCEYGEDKFSDGAVRIFMNDSVSTVSDVKLLYKRAIELDKFINATDLAGARSLADDENNALFNAIPTYKKLNNDKDPADDEDDNERKNSVISKLMGLGIEKVSTFIEKAEEYIMLERFSMAERKDIVSLLMEYADVVATELLSMTNYQLETVGIYVIGTNYRDDIQKLKDNVRTGIQNANNISIPEKPVEGKPESDSSLGFTPIGTEKPEPSGKLPENLFSDLDTVPWGVTAINTLAQKGILSGNGDGAFEPDRPVTRNEFVKMIVTAFDVEMTDSELPYEDIEKGSWSEKYIMAAVNAGIISGTDETHFGNDQDITRQDVAVIAERILAYMGVDAKSSSLKYQDADAIAEYAVTAVAKMTYIGIMNGVSEKLFAPEESTTRAMAAVVIYKLVNYYENMTKTEEETQVVTKSQSDKYDLVFALEILKEEYANDAKITRGELAAALAALGNYNYVKGESIFEDVTSTHPFYKEITAVYNNNVMAGKTQKLFMPDETVTYKEAYDAVIAVCGYAGFPAARKEAEEVLNKEAIHARAADELTVETAKRLFFAALDIPVLEMDGSGSIVVSKKTILNINFDTYKEKGVVNAVAGMTIGGRDEITDNQIIITVDSRDFIYTDGGYDFSDYLGYKVTYYYRETNGGYDVINMTASASEKLPLKLSFEQIVDAEQDLTQITYEKGRTTRTAKILRTADYIYNGRRCYDIKPADLNPDNGYLTLIDTDNDGVYDVVRIESYEYIMVAQVDVKNSTILDRFKLNSEGNENKVYGFKEGEDADKVSVTKNSRYIKLDYLAKGDILAVAKSRDGSLINAYVSDKKITGRVQSISRDEYKIQVNNDVLKCVHDFDFDGLTSSMNITVGIDWNGYAVGYYVEPTSADTLYGYLYYIGEDESTETLIFNLLSQDNEYITLESREKLMLNDKKVDNAGVYADLTKKVEEKKVENGTEITIVKYVAVPQLIAYKIDDDGKIQKIYSQSNTAENSPLKKNKSYGVDINGDGKVDHTPPEVIYNSFGLTFDFDYNILSSGKIFYITMAGGEIDRENSFVTTAGSKTIAQNSEPGKLHIYNADESLISKLCVYEPSEKTTNDTWSESFNSQAFVISKRVQTYDEENGEIVEAFKGYHAGKEVIYSIADDLKTQIDVSKLSSGDVLLIWLSGTEITKCRRLYSEHYADNKLGGIVTDRMCNYGDYNYTGEEIYNSHGNLGRPLADDRANYDYPYEWAMHIIERAEGRRDDTFVTSTRFASLYGNIEYVYKAESYPYPVIKIHVAGRPEPSAFTMDAGTYVYVYNVKNNSIRMLDNTDLNISYERAVVTARYGNVRDVIIYEED